MVLSRELVGQWAMFAAAVIARYTAYRVAEVSAATSPVFSRGSATRANHQVPIIFVNKLIKLSNKILSLRMSGAVKILVLMTDTEILSKRIINLIKM